MEQKILEEKRLLDELTSDYKILLYFPYSGDVAWSDSVEYRNDPDLRDVMDALFHGEHDKILAGEFQNATIFNDDRVALWEESRKDYVLARLTETPIFYVFFRCTVNGVLHHYKLKFIGDFENGKMKGIIMSSIDNGVIDRSRPIREAELSKAIEDKEREVMERTADLRSRLLDLQIANEEIVEMLGNIVEHRNQESGLHIKRVKAYTKTLTEQIMVDWPEYGITPDYENGIISASSLHDVGKIMIPDAVLLKPGRLTPEEFETMKKHSEYGLDVLRSAPKSWTAEYIKIACDICYCHHEKWDGKGYPRGLKGDEIPISAQIVSVADCYDALTTERVYKRAYSAEEAFNMIFSGQCGAFSDKILSSFTRVKELFENIAQNPERYLSRGSVQLTGKDKLEGLSILVVDDNEINLEICSDLLEEEGAVVCTAESGEQAIEYFFQKGPFQAVLMDVVMPGMSGIEATKRIRAKEGNTLNRTPIIALTAEGGNQQTFLDSGFDASMAKPLVIGEFTRILISCMHNSSQMMQKQLAETLKIANTDALTKMKSLAAYVDMKESLNGEIKDFENPEFAIVMCDINNLKQVNDTYGHDTGNTYIRNCSKILAQVFENCPVYRIGGDEFAVVLRNAEYKNREKLMEKLFSRVNQAKDIPEIINGKAFFAAGIAVFTSAIDKSSNDVEKRADAAMYKNKEQQKKG